MKDINEYFAEKCGIYSGKGVNGYFWSESYDEHIPHVGEEWTIEDPRCREIIREWLFEQGYVLKAGKALWTYSKLHKDYEAHIKDFHSGKNEIACLEAIYEAEKSS